MQLAIIENHNSHGRYYTGKYHLNDEMLRKNNDFR